MTPPPPDKFKENKNILISTGNILSFNKIGQKPTDEIIDCLNTTLKDPIFDEKLGEIHRTSNDLLEKINEHERIHIKIGAKIFINNKSVECLTEAVNALLRTLNVDCLDNLILAYHPKPDSTTITSLEPKTNGEVQKDYEWGGNNENSFYDLKKLWAVLETFSKQKKICQLGISDLDTDTLKKLYESCEVRPTIAKINLSACCVVPPSLQEFCNKNDIQLLTHSDPEVFLSEDSLSQWNLNGFKPTWVSRYQIHVKCRGLLTAKGYIVGASKS